MGSNNRLASPQGASAPPGGGYSQTLNINDTQGPAPTQPWGGSAPKIPPHMLSDGVVSGVTGPTPDPLPPSFKSAPLQTLKPQVLTMPAPNPVPGTGGGGGMPAPNPMFGPGGGMGMNGGGFGSGGFGSGGFGSGGFGGGCGVQQQRCPSCGK